MDFFCYEFMCVDMTVQALLTIMYLFYMCQVMLFGMCGAHSVENTVQSVPKWPDTPQMVMGLLWEKSPFFGELCYLKKHAYISRIVFSINPFVPSANIENIIIIS